MNDEEFDFAGFNSEDYPDERPPVKENPLLPKGEYVMLCGDIHADPELDYQKWMWEIVEGEREGQELVFFERPQSEHEITRKIARQHIAQMIRAINAGSDSEIRNEFDLLNHKVVVGLKHSKPHPKYPQRLEISYIRAHDEEDVMQEKERKRSVSASASKGAVNAAKSPTRQQRAAASTRQRSQTTKRQSKPMEPDDSYDEEDFDDDIPF